MLADDVQNNNIQLSDNHEIKSPVRRLWHTKVTVTTNPKRTLYVEHRGFSGNLDLQSTVSNSDGTTTAYYAGYIWNNNYAIPLRTGETIQATTRVINRTIKYNSFGDIKPTYFVKNNTYSGLLHLQEYWQNSDRTWSVIYRGTVYYNDGYRPLEAAVQEE